MEDLNNVFQMLYMGFCDLAKAIFAVKIAIDLLKHGTDGDLEGSLRSLLSGAIGYGALYSVDRILTAVQNAVGR